MLPQNLKMLTLQESISLAKKARDTELSCGGIGERLDINKSAVSHYFKT